MVVLRSFRSPLALLFACLATSIFFMFAGCLGLPDRQFVDDRVDASGGETGPSETLFSVGGVVTGLEGTGLVLRNNGQDDLPINGNGPFAFATRLKTGDGFVVTVGTQPTSPSQVCKVTGGNGTVSGASISAIVVACETEKYSVRGTVTGLVGTGLTLASNAGESLPIDANGEFAFKTKFASGSTFAISIKNQPTGPVQTCSIAGETGTIIQGDVSSVVVNCSTNTFTIGGVAAGVAGPLTLQINGGETVAVSSNGSFAFKTPLLSGTNYNVLVSAQPSSPSQTCTVTNGSGKVASAPVNNIVVTCTTNSFKVGVTVSGLVGTGLVLLNNGGNALAIPSNGFYNFGVSVLSGQNYSVTIQQQPTAPAQTCTVGAGSGTVGATNVASVTVSCATNKYVIGGNVSGLVAGTVTVHLVADSTQDKVVSASGAFAFPTPVPGGQAYTVTIASQPPGQVCVVVNGTGTVGAAPVNNIGVKCQFRENFDTDPAPALPATWSSAFAVGSGTLWYADTTFFDTAPNAAFLPGPAVYSDVGFVSPSWPVQRADARLTFVHRYAFTDTPWDGGILEISIAGGPFVELVAAGGSFAQGGYNASLNGVSPLGARTAWTGNSNAFVTTEAVLPAAAAGNNVQFKWRAGADTVVASTGWWLDTVSLDP